MSIVPIIKLAIFKNSCQNYKEIQKQLSVLDVGTICKSYKLGFKVSHINVMCILKLNIYLLSKIVLVSVYLGLATLVIKVRYYDVGIVEHHGLLMPRPI